MTTSQLHAQRSLRHVERRRHARVPVGRLLEAMRDVQQLRFGEVVADELQADRQSAGVEAARDRHAGQAGQVRRRG